MVNESDPFQDIKKALDLNLKLVAELEAIDFSTLNDDARDMLISQIKQTVGKLGRLVI